jgi:hypothetical protein
MSKLTYQDWASAAIRALVFAAACLTGIVVSVIFLHPSFSLGRLALGLFAILVCATFGACAWLIPIARARRHLDPEDFY